MDEPAKILRKGLIELGFKISEEQVRIFLLYLSELRKWNKAYNLTRLKKDEDIIIKHFLDSLLYLKVMPEGEIRVADIGSGAGFPGIPIKIIRPEIEMYLVEPTGKKCMFLTNIIRLFDLSNIEVLGKRVEELKISRDLKSSVDVAVTRALFNINEFIKKASHIVKREGILVLNKGPKVKEEIKRSKDVIYDILEVNLPFSNASRYIVRIKLQ